MVPPVEKFMSKVRKLGVGDGHQIVIYDGLGMFSAARVWWLFKMMGHRDVAVLDGGLPKWIAEGLPVDDEPPLIRDRHMMVDQKASFVKDVTEVAAASSWGIMRSLMQGHQGDLEVRRMSLERDCEKGIFQIQKMYFLNPC